MEPHQQFIDELLRLGNAVSELEDPSIRDVSEKLNDSRRDHLSHIFMIGKNLGLFDATTHGRAHIHKVTEAFNILNKIYTDKLMEVADEIAQLREQISSVRNEIQYMIIGTRGLLFTLTEDGKVSLFQGITRIDFLDKFLSIERAFTAARLFEEDPHRKRWYEYIEQRLIQARRILTMRMPIDPESISVPTEQIEMITECAFEAGNILKEAHSKMESVSELMNEIPIGILIRTKEGEPCILISGNPLAEVEEELRKEELFREDLRKTFGVSPEEVFADFEFVRTLPGGWIERRWKPRLQSQNWKET